jgi:hypothetical protein
MGSGMITAAPDVDRLLAVLATLQCGVFTRVQVHDLGGDDRLVERRLRQRRWDRVAPGVYVLPSSPPTWRRQLWIARLTADPFAVVSHEAAAAMHEWPGFPEGPVSLLVPHGTHPRVRGATMHQTRDLWLVDTMLIDQLIVTTPARTLLDLAGSGIRFGRLAAAFDHGLTNGQVAYAEIQSEMAAQARRGKPGIRLLAKVLDSRVGEPVKQSELERKHFALYDRIGGPRPVPQWSYPGREQVRGCADAGFPDALLAVETDGRKWHTRVADLKRDHHRDAEAARAGVQVLRLLHEDVVGDPEGTWNLVQETRRTRLAQLAPTNWRQ